MHVIVTYKGSFHLIEHNSLKHQRGAGIGRIFILQPPAFLPEWNVGIQTIVSDVPVIIYQKRIKTNGFSVLIFSNLKKMNLIKDKYMADFLHLAGTLEL